MFLRVMREIKKIMRLMVGASENEWFMRFYLQCHGTEGLAVIKASHCSENFKVMREVLIESSKA
jgi:hypothetical protein